MLRLEILERLGLREGIAQQFVHDVVLFVIRRFSHQVNVFGDCLVDVSREFGSLDAADSVFDLQSAPRQSPFLVLRFRCLTPSVQRAGFDSLPGRKGSAA